MIKKYLERNGKIKFILDTLNGHKIVRIKYSGSFWMNEINFLEFILMELLDRFTGFYGYRMTMDVSN